MTAFLLWFMEITPFLRRLTSALLLPGDQMLNTSHPTLMSQRFVLSCLCRYWKKIFLVIIFLLKKPPFAERFFNYTRNKLFLIKHNFSCCFIFIIISTGFTSNNSCTIKCSNISISRCC